MAATSPKALIFKSPAVRIRWLAGPRALLRGAGFCLLGLLLMGALARLAYALFGNNGMLLVVPLGALSLLLGVMVLLCGAGGILLWLTSLLSLRRPGRLWVDNALCIEHGGDREALPLVTLTSARVSPDESALLLHTRRGDSVEASIDTLDTAHRALDAIATGTVHGLWSANIYQGVDRSFWITSPPLAGVALTALATLFSYPFTTPDVALALGLSLGITGMAAAAFRNAMAADDCVTVGSDGLSIRQSNNKDRFIAFSRITEAKETPRGVLFSLAGGERVEVTLISPDLREAERSGSLSVALAEKRRAHLLERVRAEIAPREPDLFRAAALLERKGRSVRAWSSALDELLREAGGGYRKATLSKDQATQVLEDSKAPAELRIGAALALSPNDPLTAARLRVAIETCVNPAVRLALSQASYGELDDATLEAALLSVEAEADEAAEAPRRALIQR